MVLNIKDSETDRLARELASATGGSLTAAVAIALRERLERVGGRPRGHDLAAELDAIALRCAALPVLDGRPEEELLGYDETRSRRNWRARRGDATARAAIPPG